ncbi:hypothetical protein ABB02_00420 [Clostridiaceae bacterium JG1575]|nr:hypothetical protein ABB02_00420 [Clostridiaceae bacterium JG1575]
MKLKSKLLILGGAVAAGVLAHRYVNAHREELDRFLEEYGETVEKQEEDPLVES